MIARLIKNHFGGRLVGFARLSGLGFILLISILLVSCQTPTAVEAVGSGYQVREDKNAAWASIVNHNDVTILDALSLNIWKNLLKDGMVTTDDVGIAEMRNTSLGCSGLYVFQDSGIQLGSCSKGTTGNWVCVVGAATASNCNVGLASPSTDITTKGTWISLITLDNGALSIVTVLEGEAEVVPVTQLDYQYEKYTDSFSLTFTTRVLDSGQAVFLRPGQSMYTASDDYLAWLRPNLTLPPREPLGLDQFRMLIDQLLPLYPLLPRYLEVVGARASEDTFDFLASPESTLLLQGLGGYLEDTLAQEVVLQGVDWIVIQENVSEGQPVRLAFQFPGQEGLLTDQLFNPDRAIAIENEINLGQYPILLLYPSGDIQLQTVAYHMTEYLAGIGLQINLEEISPDLMDERIAVLAPTGTSVLWLIRR
ncbi:MAG: hypothetical protein MUC85_05600 [Anaerolineales bacterium]|jgi:hypothetical protein|nr:hypothetical protein [Anaerolineales bacterium]